MHACLDLPDRRLPPRVPSLPVKAAMPEWLGRLVDHVQNRAKAAGITHSVICGFSRGASWISNMVGGRDGLGLTYY